MPTLNGPAGAIPYERDALGYPSVTQRDLDESAWTRGWFHATDRLVQVQIALLAAEGRMMEHLGDKPLFRMVDRAVRHLDFGRDLDAQVAALPPAARAMVDAYCDGFAAGVRDRGWPVVLRLLGRGPTPYRPRDLARLYRLLSWFGLTSTQHMAEQVVAELVARGAPGAAFDLLLGEAAAGLDRDALRDLQMPGGLLPGPLGRGSNAFAVAGTRSASGGALLMSEFHMEVGRFPPIMYASHHRWSDNTLTGLSIPGMAWISSGRTDRVAWTYTFGHGDNIDLLVERCRDGRYLAGDTWRPLTRREEAIAVRGRRDPERVVFWDNPYGSIDGDAEAGGDLPCLRWTGLHTATAGDIAAMRALPDCATVDDLVAAHRPFATLSLNGVFADASGDVAKMHCGRVDRRPDGWTGAYPRQGWDLTDRTPEPLPESARPVTLRPADGLVVSANEPVPGWANLPEPAYRFERLGELLREMRSVALPDLVRASYDTHDRCLERLGPTFERLLPEAAPLDASRFHALHHEVMIAVLEPHLGATARALFDGLGLTLAFQHTLDRALALERPAVLDEGTLAAALHRAWPRALDRLAAGETLPIRARFTNTLTQGALPSFLGWSSPPVSYPGTPTTPFQARRVSLHGERVYGGPAFHFTCDLSTPGAWYHVPGGASERRLGPGYGAGLDLWRDGRFLPLGDPPGESPDLG